MTSGNFLLLFLCVIPIHSEGEFFYGGSISYKLEVIAGKKIAHVELITGWELGKGPCGRGCSKKDVNTQTNARRTQTIANTGISTYFGHFTTDYKITGGTEIRDLNDIVNANYSEWVIAVSESAKWEQELMKFSFEMLDKPEDVNFDGKFWRPLNESKFQVWHFQTNIDHSIRSDTGSMNSCPIAFTKSYYRVRLGNVTTIQIPMIDSEGDMVKCEKGKFVEGGNLPEFPGITVETDESVCKVKIDASPSLGYKDDFWIAIPVTFQDFNKGPIVFGKDQYQAGAFALSKSMAQFAVQILENLVTPKFVPPTRKGQHMFIVYAGSTWSTDIYAEAPINTTIEEFITSGRDMEQVNITDIYDDASRDRVKYTTMSWTPTMQDVGQHILCIRAVDNTGVDEIRCFPIEVREDTFNNSSPVVAGKPYFIDIPSIDQFVNCKIGATCLIPIYVKSNAKVTKIEIVESYTEEASIGDIDTVTENGGDDTYKTILSFTHSIPGVEKICLRATNIHKAISETVCINPEIEYPDPCLSTPCRNSASCISDKTTGTFICKCISNKFYGTLCENITDVCKPDPCVHGKCYDNSGFYCFCTGSGYEGTYCETNTNDCKDGSCNTTTGTCRDLVNGKTCDCYQRYSGDNCEHDNCPDESPDVFECPADGCSNNTCSGHGVCSKGGVCTCKHGYNLDEKCSTNVWAYPGVTSIKFVSPSPMDKSQFTCFVNSKTVAQCNIPLFVATTNSQSVSWTIDTSNDLSQASSAENPHKTTVLEGIDNLFSADVVIRGTLKDLRGHFVCATANDGSSTAEICLELTFVNEPQQDPSQSSASIKFLEPTPLEGSTFVGIVGERYTVILYTSPTTTPCEHVISNIGGVTVFPAKDDGAGKCVTEASFAFNDTNIFDVCFQSAKTDFQKRCFTAKGAAAGKAPCEGDPCQNNGHCFPNGVNSFRCICPAQYKGQNCEEGPCQVNNCQNEAYCRVYNNTESCLCKAGYTGQHCEYKSSDKESQLLFTGVAKPKLFQCVIYQPCSVALLLTGDTGPRPDVRAGYVSPAVKLGDIGVTQQGATGSFQVDIGLKATELGEKDVCIQSIDSTDTNIDELCFKVRVVKEVSSLYGFKDRPHFLYPSLPQDAKVECTESKPCHVIYHVTAGKGNEQQCISAAPSANNEIRASHIFTTCESCTPGLTTTGNCSIDISVDSDTNDVGNERRFCLGLSLVSTDILGEERCFSLTIEAKSTNNVKNGCQKLHCQNGGFCDGHDPTSPTCYCKSGFSGNNCSQGGLSTASGSHSQSFLGNLAVPSEIRCEVGHTCSVQFKVLAATGQNPVVSIGYSDPPLSVDKPTYLSSGASSNTVSGYVDVHPSEEGTFRFCLQTNENSQTVEEMCVTVLVQDATQNNIDMSKPHFVNPTLPSESTVLCLESKPCYLDLYFTKGDNFGLIGKCPTLAKTGDVTLSDLHIFNPTQLTSSCNSDVGFTLPQDETQSICFQLLIPGKKGETRCFTVQTVPDLTIQVTSPCTGKTCEHDGKCVADLNNDKYTCVCSMGFDGDTCEKTYLPTNLPGLKNISSNLDPSHFSQHFDGTSGVPKDVNCDSINPCCIVIPYHGDSTHKPIPGFKDDDINVQSEAVITPDASKPQLNHYKTCVQAPSGEYTMCYQTTTNGTKEGVNVDEICFKVKISPGGQTVSSEPKFTNTISNGSSVSCQPKSVCHIPVETDLKPGGDCGQVKECGTGVKDAHVFETRKVDNKCLTDVSLKTGDRNKTDTICLSAGNGGEERDILVVTEKVDGYGPCQELHCINGGSCIANNTSAYCKCRNGFRGKLCEIDETPCIGVTCSNGGKCIVDQSSSPHTHNCICPQGFSGDECGTTDTPTHLPGVKNMSSSINAIQHFDSSSGVPKNIKCDMVNPCCFVIPYYGDKNLRPVNGYHDQEMNILSQDVVTPDLSKHDFNHYITCVTSSKLGTNKMCLQTTVNGTDKSMNVDEICVEVDFSAGGQAITSEPKFTNTISNGSSVSCQHKSVCHIPVETNLKPGGDCEQVSECGEGITGVYVFKTTQVGNKCLTDVSLKTEDTDKTDGLCLSAGNGGEEREILVVTEKVEGYGPCQQLHCINGGRCISNSSSAYCKCQNGFRGETCEIDETSCVGATCLNGGKCIVDHSSNQHSCVCAQGFSGDDCGTPDNPTHLPGVKNVSSSINVIQHFDSSSGVPKNVKCDMVNPCCFVMPYYGDKPPVNGYHDQEMNIFSQDVVTPDLSKHDFNHYITCVTSSKEGTNKMCLQTTVNGTDKSYYNTSEYKIKTKDRCSYYCSMNVDEICVEVEFSAGGQAIMSEPKFTNTISNGSSVSCQHKSVCHIPVETNLKPSGDCEQVSECGEGITGVYVFKTTKVGDKCLTDVSLKTEDTDKTDGLCLSAGNGGEERKILVVTEKVEGYGPCQQLHCINGGRCISNSSSAYCKCPDGFNGNTCEIAPTVGVTCLNGGTNIVDHSSSQQTHICVCPQGFSGDDCGTPDKPNHLPGVKNVSSSLNVTQHFDGSSGVPKNVKCDMVNPCCFVIPYYGDKTLKPLNGYKDWDIKILSQDATTPDQSKLDFHHFKTCVNGSKVGTYRMCLQTTVDGTNKGMNVDEICTEVEFSVGEHKTTLEPKFTNTLSNGSSVSCQLKSICHIPIETGKNGENCDQVKECGDGVTGVYVFQTTKVGDKCLTDVSIKTGDHASTDRLCLSAGNGGEERDIVVVTEKTESYGPCQELHCLNQGKCYATEPNKAKCTCQSEFQGDACESAVSVSSTVAPSTTVTNAAPSASVTSLAPSATVTNAAPATTVTNVAPSDSITNAAPSATVTNAAPAASVTNAAPSASVTNAAPAVSVTNTAPPATVTSVAPSATVTNAAPSASVTNAAHSASVTNAAPAASVTNAVPSASVTNAAPSATVTNAAPATTVTNAAPSASVTDSAPETIVINASPSVFVTNASPSAYDTNVATSTTVANASPLTNVHTAASADVVPTPPLPASGSHFSTSNTMAASPDSSNTTGQCDNKKAKRNAESIVKRGYASCFCLVSDKKLYIIKKRPVAQKKDIIKAAGFGAGGMVGTMVLGIVVYAIVNKVKSTSQNTQPSRELPTKRRPLSPFKSRVFPIKKAKQVPLRSELDF